MPLLNEMLKNPNVIAVKNSSMPTQDIQMFKDAGIQARGADGFAVFNGPDEQFVSGRVMGADGGIGGTYAVMPELFLKMNELIEKGDIPLPADPVQGGPHHLQDVRGPRQPVRGHEGDPAPHVRSGAGRRARPLPGLIPEDEPIVAEAQKMIEDAVAACKRCEMIVDSFDYIACYKGLHPNLDKAIDWLNSHTLDAGKRQDHH